MKTPRIETIAHGLGQRRIRWLIVVLALVLPLPSLGGGMIADDHHFRMLVRDAPGMSGLSQSPLDMFNFTGMNPANKAARKARGLSVWWTPPDMQIAFWRPVSALTHWLDNTAWPEHAWLMHLHNVLWYGILVAAVLLLYRRIGMPPWLAALAALLYAVDDAHAIPIAWIAGRNALLSGLFGVLCLLAHDAWRRQNKRVAGVVAPVLFALGLLSAEAAAATGGFLLAYAVFMEPGGRWKRAASLIPYVCVGILWRVLYKYLGYGVAASHLYLEPMEQPLAYLKNVLTNIPLMLSGQFAFPDPTMWLVLNTTGRIALLAWALVVIATVLWLLWPGLKREREIRFWLAGTLVAMAPFCATWPQNRLMILPGIGALALLTRAIVSGMGHNQSESPEFRSHNTRWKRNVAVVLLVFNALVAPLMFAGASAAVRLAPAYMARLDKSMPATQGVEETNVVIVSAPVDVFAVSIPIRRSSKREPVPRSVLLLRGGLASADIFRVDSHTIIVTTPEGLVEQPWSMMFRNVDTHPFRVGETVRLDAVEITVLSVTPRGNPIETRFRFDQPLEKVAEWRIWDGDRFAPFALPQVGDSAQIPPRGLREFARAVLRGSLGLTE
jgi:hypothetical protein